MNRWHWGLGFLILVSCVFILGLFNYLPVESQGPDANPTTPNSLMDNTRGTDIGKKSTGGGRIVASVPVTYIQNIYLPLTFKNYSTLNRPLDKEDLIISSLASNTDDHWRMDLTAGDTITITAAPGSMADIVLTVLDIHGNRLVDEQNLSPAGEVETIKDLNIVETGKYDLLIRAEQGEKTDYALMLLDAVSYNFDFRGRLLDNSSRSDSLPVDTDHFWFFTAQSGESVSFIITPDSGGDAYVELFNPLGERMLTLDSGDVGDPETSGTLILVDGGMYGIRVGEFDFGPMVYQIALSKL